MSVVKGGTVTLEWVGGKPFVPELATAPKCACDNPQPTTVRQGALVLRVCSQCDRLTPHLEGR